MKINAYIMDHMDNADLSGVAKAVDLLATLAMHSEDMQKLLEDVIDRIKRKQKQRNLIQQQQDISSPIKTTNQIIIKKSKWYVLIMKQWFQ